MEIKNKRHEAFVREYLTNSRNATKAYMAVYNVGTFSAEVLGHKLLSNIKVKAAIAEEDTKLANKFEKKYEISKDILVNTLIKVIKDAQNDGDKKSIIQAVQVLNKMLGYDVPIKSEVEHKGLTITYIKPE